MSDTGQYGQDIYYEGSHMFEYIGRHDGWIASLLLFSIIFGLATSPGVALPPIRFVDFKIVFLLATRWLKSVRFYGGFVFSYRMRTFSVFETLLQFLA